MHYRITLQERCSLRNLAIGLLLAACSAFSITESTASMSEWLIEPGKSLAKLKLGMTMADILKVLGPPTIKRHGRIEYWSKDHQHFVAAFLQDDKLVEVIFSSPKFRTLDELSTANFDESSRQSAFNFQKLKSSNLNLKYQLRTGGLAFVVANADAYSKDHRMRLGVLYSGNAAPFPPIAAKDLPEGGWQNWTGDMADVKEGLHEVEASKLEVNYPSSVPGEPQIWPVGSTAPATPPPRGTWSWREASVATNSRKSDTGASLTLDIKPDGNKIAVSYSMTTTNALHIDQGDMEGVWTGNHATVKFKSDSFAGSGTGELIYQRSKLYWKKGVSESTEDKTDWLPEEAILTRGTK